MKPVYDFLQHCFTREPIRGPVLEIGSGRKRFIRVLFGRRYKVVTSNIYPRNVVDRICSVTCLPFQDNEFGCVVCEHVLEHVEEPQRAISQMRQVLKPGGLLILISPFSWSIHDKPYDLWRFSEEGLRQLLAPHFEAVSCEVIGNPRNPRLLCVTARKPIRPTRTTHPKVSVIMPTYNRAGMIGRSIKSMLKQTFKDWELIIVSDGGTDNTPEVVCRYRDRRIRYFRVAHAGCASARNYGIKRSRGEYIAYCDDDDQLMPFHLEVLCNYLDRHPELAMARGDSVNIPENHRGYQGMGTFTGAMHKKSSLKETGLFDKNIPLHSDTELMLRFFDRLPVKKFDIDLICRHLHKTNLTIQKRSLIKQSDDFIYYRRADEIFRDKGLHLCAGELLFIVNVFLQRGLKQTAGLAARELAKKFKKGEKSKQDYWLKPRLTRKIINGLKSNGMNELRKFFGFLLLAPDETDIPNTRIL